MDLEKLQRDLKNSYNKKLETLNDRVIDTVNHLEKEWSVKPQELTLHEIKTIATSIVNIETQTLHNEVESLLAQKEQIERELQRKSQSLQLAKYDVFDALESQVDKDDTETLSKLHQVKLQSVDLFDLLSEVVESAIITILEQANDSSLKETIEEVIKELTYETIKEGSLNTIRVRKILSTILYASIDIAEATPNILEDILSATLRGMRSGLLLSIDRFKQRLAFMPIEAKHILIEDYDTIIEDLNQTDILFSQVVQTQADESSKEIQEVLLKLNKNMQYDLEELVRHSKETAEIMKTRFSSLAKTAVKKGENALHSPTAKEAKRMGQQALGVAKVALGNALKSAKNVMESKEK